MPTKSFKIIDAKTKEPLFGANVYVTNNTSIGTISDFDGKVTLTTPNASDNITISYLGYKPQKYPLSSIPSTVNLVAEVGQLDEVVITVKKDKPENTWVKPALLLGLGLLVLSSLLDSGEEAPPIKKLKV